MRIAMVGSRGIPAPGGVESVVRALTKHLLARGHEVIVYGRAHCLVGAPGPEAGTVILTPGLRGKHAETITHTATAMWDLLRRKVDVVHVHSPGPALLSWMPVLAGKPVVFTVHGPDWRGPKWSGSAKSVLGLGLRIGMRTAAAVTAVSKSLADELSERFGREVTFIPNGAEPVRPEPLERIRRWGLEHENYALFIGRIELGKRLALLLKAWEALASEPGDYKLVVVGDWQTSPYGRECRRAAGKNVMFLGMQLGPTLAELCSHAAVFVQPSVLEGMSMVILEAAAYGRCILASDIPENVDIMDESAVYFTRDDPADLAGKLGQYLRSPGDRQRMGDLARDHVTASFPWASSAAGMEKIYRSVLSARRVRARKERT